MHRMIIMFLAVVMFSSNSFAEVIDGKICYTERKTYKYICREPINSEDLQRNLNADSKERADRKFSACKFSQLSIWSGLVTWLWEVDRLRKELVTLRGARQMDAKELYWAQQDINKQAILPSETVRAAYETAAYYGKSIATYDAQINAKEWCIQCAIKRNNGIDVCD